MRANSWSCRVRLTLPDGRLPDPFGISRLTGTLTMEPFERGDLSKVMVEASERSMPLSAARFSFDGAADERTGLDAARLMTRLIRNIDFATRDEEGAILAAFTQTDLRGAHVFVRRLAGALKNT